MKNEEVKKKQKTEPEKDKKKNDLKRKILWVAVGYTLVKIVFTLFHLFYCPAPPKSHNFNQGQNAAWLRHQWFSEKKSPDELDRLAKKLHRLQVTTVYIHTGPLNSKGEIPEFDPAVWHANRDGMRERIPGLVMLAWLGGLNQTRFGKASDTLDMNNEKVLGSIACRAREMVYEQGFDGVHYDVEPAPDDSTGFIRLLSKTRRALPRQLISVASPHVLYPDQMAKLIRRGSKGRLALWSTAYYRKVALHCDEIAVMAYDSVNFTDASYRKFMIYQVKNVSRAISGTGCRFLVGIPSYDDKTFSHRPNVENVENAINGTVMGLERTTQRKPFQGIAIYALWTTDSREMDDYHRLWIQPLAGTAQEKEKSYREDFFSCIK